MTQFSDRYYRPYTSAENVIRRFVRDKLKLTPKVPWLFKWIAALPDNASVLDIGCGTGGFLELIERSHLGLKTYGIDIGQPPSFRSRAIYIRGSALNLPFADNSFDLVTCAHVIEHLQDPEACAREIARVTRSGGYLYIETPSPRSAWMPLFNTFWDDPTHIRPYSQVGLKRLLEIVGVEPVVSGVKCSIPAILFGIPYLLIGMALGDRQAKAMFAIYAFGFTVYAAGKKS